MSKKKSIELTDTQKRFIKIYDKRLMSKKSVRNIDKVNNHGRGKTNKFIEIETKNFIHELTGIAQLRKYLDEGKIPSGYNELLNTKEPKLKKIINFFKSNYESAEILFLYLDHLNTEYESSVSNRNKIIYLKYNELIEANKRIITLTDNNKEGEILKRKNEILEIEKENLEIEKEDLEYVIEDINKKKKWSHLHTEIDRLFNTGMSKIKAIEYIIDNSNDERLKIELKNGITKKQLTSKIKRSLYR